MNMKPSMTNYELKEYRPYFTDERWEEIQTIINHWIHPKMDNGKTINGVIMNPESEIIFVCKDFETESSHMKDHFRKKVFENVLTEEEYDQCSKFTFNTFHEQNEKRKFDAAKKIPESEWDAPVFHADDFYGSVEEFKDMWVCDNDPEEDPYPEYVQASVKERTFSPRDLEYAIDSILERVGTFDNDWEPNNPAIPSYLQEAWDKFCEEHGQYYYEEDRHVVILLDKN